MTSSKHKLNTRFRWVSPQPADTIIKHIKEHFDVHQPDLTLKIERHYVKIGIPTKEQTFWSPQLGINIYENEEGTVIRGLYGPKPNVWLLFWFGYIFLGFVTLLAGMYVLSMRSLGIFSYFIYLLPFTLGGIITLILSHKFGKKMGQPGIIKIKDFLEQPLFELTESQELEL